MRFCCMYRCRVANRALSARRAAAWAAEGRSGEESDEEECADDVFFPAFCSLLIRRASFRARFSSFKRFFSDFAGVSEI